VNAKVSFRLVQKLSQLRPPASPLNLLLLLPYHPFLIFSGLLTLDFLLFLLLTTRDGLGKARPTSTLLDLSDDALSTWTCV